MKNSLDFTKFSELQIAGLCKKIKFKRVRFCLNYIVCYLKDLKQAFRLFDKEGKGVVTTQEIGSVLRNLGLFPTEQELLQMLKDIDIDGLFRLMFSLVSILLII